MADDKVKTEGPPKPSTPLLRLPSFRQPRDLTLGGGNSSRAGALAVAGNKARKSYTPNLVQRSKIKEEIKVKDEAPKSRGDSKGRGRGERGRNERGRGKGANVIQLSSGVFSEGLGVAARRSDRNRFSSDSPSNYIPKPKLNLKQSFTADSKEEGERLRQLLQDNFIDDPNAVMDGVKPLQLPMMPMKKRGGAVVKKEKADHDLTADASLDDKKSVIKIKKEPDVDGDTDVKPAVGEDAWALYDRCVGDLLGSREPEYILLQLPDCLPGLRPSTEAERQSGKNINSSSSNTSHEATLENEPKSQCTLASLPEGHIGKIQLLKSGRARLQLGAVCLPISMGTQVAFRQDLISVNIDDLRKSGTMINIGQVRTRVVSTPDWENMLRKV